VGVLQGAHIIRAVSAHQCVIACHTYAFKRRTIINITIWNLVEKNSSHRIEEISDLPLREGKRGDE
jgi:hypothetical protein